MLLKTKSGRSVEMPSPEEDAAITAAALTDPDAAPLTDEEWAEVKPFLRRGRPPADVTKELISIRVDRDVLDAFRATGTGWQTRMNNAIKDWLKTHDPA